MKQVRRTTQFKALHKQRIAKNEQLRKAFKTGVENFLQDRKTVGDHSLKDKMTGLRAFYIADDCRVVYLERQDYFLFIDVGSHKEVYYH